MDISFTPSPDVVVILNSLLDKLENRASRPHFTTNNNNTEPPSRITHHTPRPIKLTITDLPLPAYFSQTDPEPRIIANRQFQELERLGLLQLTWLPGQAGHILEAVNLQVEHASRNTHHVVPLYNILHRAPLATSRTALEATLLADQFRFSSDDWRAGAVRHILGQLRAGKSPTPFSLTDTEWNLDLLTLLAALPGIESETPYRVFSVRIFNDSKRFEELKPALVHLARHANPQWKTLPTEELLQELNLVANPNYIHLAGNWQFTTCSGEILSLGGFAPSIGFPAAQIAAIQSATIHADAALCIENLTTFHEFARFYASRITHHNTSSGSNRQFHFAILCTMGNPSPAIRRLLCLLPEETPIYLWADLDYGGFNILNQLRRQVSPRILPYLMDTATFDTCTHFSRPLTCNDQRNFKKLATHIAMEDVRPVIEHLLKKGLKLEQEAIGVANLPKGL